MKSFGQWLANSAAALGPWGIFLVALGDSAFVPLPQGVDALLMAQAIAAPSTAWLAAGLAVLGSLLGSLILYGLARKAGRMMLEKRVSERGIKKMRLQMEQYGALALIVPTMIPLPLPMKLFVIGAGVFRLPLTHFCAAIVFGRVVRYGGEAAIAVRYGENATQFLKENAPAAIAIALVLIALFFGVHRWSTRRVQEG